MQATPATSLEFSVNPALQSISTLSSHASVRLQQRGVQRDVLDCLLTYGKADHDHHGCQIVTFDGRAMEHIGRHEPRPVKSKVSDHRNVYVVLNSDGMVVTAGHRFKKVLRDLSQSSLRPGRHRRPHSHRRALEQVAQAV